MLHKSEVIFNSGSHTYSLNGVALSGITGMINRQLFPDKYKAIPENILNKAAEKGHSIHEVCEIIDDLGVEHHSDEAHNYQLLKEQFGLEYVCSEYLVSDNKYFASCIDKVFKNGDGYDLGDIKTTYKLDKEYLSWQLSIYAFFFEMNNPGAKVKRLLGIWLRGPISELVEVERIPEAVVIDLLTSEVNGEQFVNPYKKEVQAFSLPMAEEAVKEVLSQAKYWADKAKELKDGIMKEMVKAGAYSYEGEIKITRKKDSIRKDFDKDSFRNDYPELFEKYIKQVPVLGSITIK